MQRPLVSVIMPSYNCAPFVRDSAHSVLAQSMKDFELLIVDDCSTDGTWELVTEIAQDPRVRTFRNAKNSGPAKTRNRAIEEARGRYIAFLDADDLWAPEKLSRQLAFMESMRASLSYSAYHVISEDGQPLYTLPLSASTVDYSTLLKGNVIGCLTAIYDTQLIGRVLMPDILKRQDYGLWLRILKSGPIAFGLNEPLATYRLRTNSVSSNKMLAAQYQWKLYREIERLSIVKSAYYFFQYALSNILKRVKVRSGAPT